MNRAGLKKGRQIAGMFLKVEAEVVTNSSNKVHQTQAHPCIPSIIKDLAKTSSKTLTDHWTMQNDPDSWSHKRGHQEQVSITIPINIFVQTREATFPEGQTLKAPSYQVREI